VVHEWCCRLPHEARVFVLYFFERVVFVLGLLYFQFAYSAWPEPVGSGSTFFLLLGANLECVGVWLVQWSPGWIP
jgi:hypothetical protein